MKKRKERKGECLKDYIKGYLEMGVGGGRDEGGGGCRLEEKQHEEE